MKLIHLLIIKMLLLTSGLVKSLEAATGNVHDAINMSTKRQDMNLNTRDKRSFGLAILASLLNSAPAPQPAPKAPMPATAAPPPQYIFNPAYGYQPNLPYAPDNNGYVNFKVPDGYVLVTPPPPAPPATQAPPAQSAVNTKLQQKQSFLNFLANLSAQSAPQPTTQAPATPPPPAILVPNTFYPSYDQQYRDRLLYKYAQNHDISSEAHVNDVAPQYQYPATPAAHGPPAYSGDSYYQEGIVGSSYHKSPHHAYEQEYIAQPERFRISYPDDTEYYHPKPSEIGQQQHEDLQHEVKQSYEEPQSGKEYSKSYGY